jgi:polysaccharide deacetylase 2 family uncharacterized protein YibQ
MTEKKKKGSGVGTFILVVLIALILAGLAGFFYASQKSKPKDLSTVKKNEAVDLMEESKRAHHALDEILMKRAETWQLQDSDRKEHTETIPATGAEIHYTQREVDVGVPATTELKGASAWVVQQIPSHSVLHVLNEGPAKYDGYEAYRLDLGISVKNGDAGEKTFVTDSVYFFHNRNLTKKDKDIPKTTAQSKPTPSGTKHFGKLAVVIDDCGYDNASLRKLLSTRLPFSYAVIPYKSGSREALRLIRNAGRTAMLHMPMEPIDRGQMSEPGRTILVSQTDAQVRKLLTDALDSLPGVSGVNNHQGSRATGDAETMRVVMKVLKERGLFFVDSRTSSQSVGMATARRYGVPTGMNSLFGKPWTGPTVTAASLSSVTPARRRPRRGQPISTKSRPRAFRSCQ